MGTHLLHLSRGIHTEWDSNPRPSDLQVESTNHYTTVLPLIWIQWGPRISWALVMENACSKLLSNCIQQVNHLIETGLHCTGNVIKILIGMELSQPSPLPVHHLSTIPHFTHPLSSHSSIAVTDSILVRTHTKHGTNTRVKSWTKPWSRTCRRALFKSWESKL